MFTLVSGHLSLSLDPDLWNGHSRSSLQEEQADARLW